MTLGAVRRIGLADTPHIDSWIGATRSRLRATAVGLVRELADTHLRDAGEEYPPVLSLITDMLGSGKYLRPLFALVGWRSGAPETLAAARAAAALELLHLAALIQDDMMDGSSVRRGRAAMHVQLAAWHRHRLLPGDCERFGESAATLASDLCLVWGEQAFRESGMDAAALERGWPHYDALRTELIFGQLRDISGHLGDGAELSSRFDVAREKSGNYTVRRPLELGATMADADERVIDTLTGYGELIGEAFQLHDDLCDLLGPVEDVRTDRANAVMALAGELASTAARAELARLARQCERDEVARRRWQAAMLRTGVRELADELIEERVTAAVDLAANGTLDPFTTGVLTTLARASVGGREVRG